VPDAGATRRTLAQGEVVKEPAQDPNAAVDAAGWRPGAVDPLRRAVWPRPSTPVLGKRDGFGQHVLCALYAAAVGCLWRLPSRPRRRAIDALAWLAHSIDRRRAAVARDYIRTACPDLPPEALERRVRAAFAHLVEVTLDAEWRAARVPPERLLDYVELDISPAARALFASGRGVVCATAHCGDWELAGTAMAWVAPQPVYVVSRPPANKPLSARAQALRERFGMRLVPRRGAMQESGPIVRGGGMLALMLDQRPRGGGEEGLFFGRAAAYDRSAGVLVKRLRAPLLFAAAWRVGERRWRLVADVVLEPEQQARMPVAELTRMVNRELERLILVEPDQVFWLHDRYGLRRGRPGPGGSLPGQAAGHGESSR
jgi:KDO2-lipid IV(A) lauroyltransferase